MISTEMMKSRINAPKKELKGKFQSYLHEFMESDNMTLKLNCSNENEASNCYTAMMYGRKSHNYNITVWKRGCGVYVIKG